MKKSYKNIEIVTVDKKEYISVKVLKKILKELGINISLTK